MKWTVLAAVALVGMAGCAEKPIEEMGYAERQKLAVDIMSRCDDLGIGPSDPRRGACLMAEADAEKARRARNTQRLQAAAAALSNAGENMQRQAQYNRSVTCNTQRAVGWGSSTTTCY